MPGNAKRYDLLEILTIALTATICGAKICSDFADFAADREDLFREFLRLENGVPSHDAFSRVFRLLDPTAFARYFGLFVDGLGSAGKGVIAIDGKTLWRSFDDAPRAHGSVENGLHWVLDVVFEEDRARNHKDHGSETLTTLRKLALNILNRARPEISTSRKRKCAGWPNHFARSIIAKCDSPAAHRDAP